MTCQIRIGPRWAGSGVHDRNRWCYRHYFDATECSVIPNQRYTQNWFRLGAPRHHTFPHCLCASVDIQKLYRWIVIGLVLPISSNSDWRFKFDRIIRFRDIDAYTEEFSMKSYIDNRHNYNSYIRCPPVVQSNAPTFQLDEVLNLVKLQNAWKIHFQIHSFWLN